MAAVTVTRCAEIPDTLRLARAKSSPNFGPKLLFFSGGSALNEVSRRLKQYTHNSAHLITPFDSGGSSAVLRDAFGMPAVGDLRSRLMALADETELGQPDIYALFSYRLPRDADPAALRVELDRVLDGSHRLMRAVSQPMRSLILTQLRSFAAMMPDDLDLRGASIGNLILAGGYFSNGRALEPVLFLMSKMVAVQGTVRAVVDENLHIGVELESGHVIHGQRQLTGKEVAPIDSPIRRIFLSDGTAELDGAAFRLPKRNRRLVERADLICYPPGSLFSSVIANLLPCGVGRAIAERSVPKVYVPSLGHDPECLGMDLSDQIEALLRPLRADAGECGGGLLDLLLCDGLSVPEAERRRIERRHGVTVLATDLVDPALPHVYHPHRLCEALVSLA